MRCEEFENIVFSGGEITQAMREHAQDCEACRALLEQADVLSGARTLDAQTAVPPSFCAGWRAAIRKEAAKETPMTLLLRAKAWLLGGKRPLVRGFAYAMCALVLVGVGAQLSGSGSVTEAYTASMENANPVMMRAAGGESVMISAAYDEMAPEETMSTGSEDTAKIVRTAQLSIRVADVEAAAETLKAQTASMGGSVSYCEIYGAKNTGRYASLELHIPSESLDAFLAGSGELGTVTHQVARQTDLTNQYADNASRLETARAKKQRLDALYAQAQDMTDIVTLTDALFDVQQEIDDLTGANQRIDRRVALSQVSIQLDEMETVEPRASFSKRISESFRDGIWSIAECMEDLVLFAAWALPGVAVIALIVLAVYAGRKLVRRLKGK